LQKRLYFSEEEILSFGEYMMRYVPIMLQNLLIENFNACLDPKSLKLFKEFSIAKNKVLKKVALRERVNPLPLIRVQE